MRHLPSITILRRLVCLSVWCFAIRAARKREVSNRGAPATERISSPAHATYACVCVSACTPLAAGWLRPLIPLHTPARRPGCEGQLPKLSTRDILRYIVCGDCMVKHPKCDLKILYFLRLDLRPTIGSSSICPARPPHARATAGTRARPARCTRTRCGVAQARARCAAGVGNTISLSKAARDSPADPVAPREPSSAAPCAWVVAH